jgi:hypothetical protein
MKLNIRARLDWERVKHNNAKGGKNLLICYFMVSCVGYKRRGKIKRGERKQDREWRGR